MKYFQIINHDFRHRCLWSVQTKSTYFYLTKYTVTQNYIHFYFNILFFMEIETQKHDFYQLRSNCLYYLFIIRMWHDQSSKKQFFYFRKSFPPQEYHLHLGYNRTWNFPQTTPGCCWCNLNSDLRYVFNIKCT